MVRVNICRVQALTMRKNSIMTSLAKVFRRIFILFLAANLLGLSNWGGDLTLPIRYGISRAEAGEKGWVSALGKKLCAKYLTENRVDSSSDLQSQSSKTSKYFRLLNFYSPLKAVWLNKDKRFFTFIESPLLGVLSQLPGVELARWLGGDTAPFLYTFKDSYLSYQLTNLFRNGINLRKDISDRTAVFVNWYYTVLSYSAITAGPTLVSANTDQESIYAWSLVTFSALWPIVTQTLARRIFIPLLFSRFLRKSQLEMIFDTNVPTKSILLDLTNQQKLIESHLSPESADLSLVLDTQALLTEAGFSGAVDGSNLSEKFLNEELTNVKSAIKWTHFFRKDLKPGEKVPLVRKKLYWGAKTAMTTVIATTMIASYFLMRWQLVGEGPYDPEPGIIQDGIEYLVETLDPDVQLSKDALHAATQEVLATIQDHVAR